MNKFPKTTIDSGHMHAWSLYAPTSWRHFVCLLFSIIACRISGSASLTAHLPLELQHRLYPNIERGRSLVKFGQFWAAVFRVKLYWENAPLFNYGAWDLKHGQTEWDLVPDDIFLCLDTGHLILGTKSPDEARERISAIISLRGGQIKHLHIHENDLIRDIHSRPKDIITEGILKKITEGRTFIFEK